MTAQQTFVSRGKRRVEPKVDEAIILGIGTSLPKLDENGDEVYDENDELVYEVTYTHDYTFRRPSDARLTLMIASFGSGAKMVNQAGEIIATLEAMLSRSDYDHLRARFETDDDERRVEIDDLGAIVLQCLEAWSEDDGFPTQPPSGSSGASRRTGGSSTGRSRGKAVTPSTSRSRNS